MEEGNGGGSVGESSELGSKNQTNDDDSRWLGESSIFERSVAADGEGRYRLKVSKVFEQS